MKPSILFVFLFYAVCFAQDTGARYLIITYDDYYDIVQPLADWKTQKGYKTKIVTLSDIGSSDSIHIRNYVMNAYNTWELKPEFLLLVGSDDQIPFPQSGSGFETYHTDNYYTNVTGDFHNELLPGRFWVNDTLEAKTVVAKVLGYERDPCQDDSLWIKKGVTIVNEDDYPPLDDSIYWADARYVYGLMNDAGFVHIDSFAQSFGNTYLDVIDAMNDGRSYILYRGIGLGIWDAPFGYMPTDSMYNGYMSPIVVSATCATIDGIGWHWLDAGTPEEPKGIVGFLGTTTALNHAADLRSALAKGSFESIFCDSFTTLGKATEAGRLNYVALFGDELEYYSWTCLGDPEMTVWTTIPRHIDVIHPAVLKTGVCTVSVNVQYNAMPVESALVCVMARKDTFFYQYGRTNNLGTIEFIDTLTIPGDSVLVTVTGRNLEPYRGTIGTSFVGGPYVLLNSFSISDSVGGNGDSIANPGEDIEIPLWVRNWGDSTAHSVSGCIPAITSSSFFSVYDTIKYFSDIAPLDSAYTSDDGYNIVITPRCPDKQKIQLQLFTRDNNDSVWVSYFHFIIHAPSLRVHNYFFAESLKYTTAGDSNQLTVVLKNVGSYKAENVIATISTDDTSLVIIDSTSSFGTILSDSSASNQSNPFTIITDSIIPDGYPINITCAVFSGIYTDTAEFIIYVGQRDYLIWDPDLNHSSGPVIQAHLDSLGFYGDYTTAFPYTYLSLYKSLIVCAGVEPNNYIIKDTSRVAQEIEAYLVSLGGKMYLEGGNVWFTDPVIRDGYDFCPLFDINPIFSFGPLTNVSGINNTFTQDMYFSYQGEINSVDQIDSINGSLLIFQRLTPSVRNCGVAANNRTVGLSFEFGGLVNGLSTKLALIDSIMDYFGIPPTGIQERQMLHNYCSPSLTVYPTLCRHSVKIHYNIGIDSDHAELKIYDVTGRLVKQFDNTTTKPSDHITWDGTDDIGREVAEGIYFVSLTIKSMESTVHYTKTEKIVLIK
jgi:hypothetical protein